LRYWKQLVFILVAEDLDDTRQLLRTLLELRGHAVTEAANGQEAIKAAQEHPPDMILMDINMPVMDGIAAIQALRSYPSTKEIPIVALTARADGEWRERILSAGCNAILRKPVPFDEVEATIRRLTDGDIDSVGPHSAAKK
jgi:two-component system, cell cycle response regulator DivK